MAYFRVSISMSYSYEKVRSEIIGIIIRQIALVGNQNATTLKGLEKQEMDNVIPRIESHLDILLL
jgi:hypothetical protein